ncbi:hypothetical protein BGZ50_001539 [Haplosporangium sp. Z 11]|nr:hypothetical protein BGZ50_001539 [Haplosporangium sp. Z 11]
MLPSNNISAQYSIQQQHKNDADLSVTTATAVTVTPTPASPNSYPAGHSFAMVYAQSQSYTQPPSYVQSNRYQNSTSHVFQTGNTGLYSHHTNRPTQLWPSTAATDSASRNRMRCLSSRSVDSNASSVGVGHLAPAMAAMSVQNHHQHPASPTTNSPYGSYAASPQQQQHQQNAFQHYYHQQQQQKQSSATSSPYPHHSPFSSPLQQSHLPAYSSLSMAAANIATSFYGSTPPSHSTADILCHSPSSYGSLSTVPSTQTYTGTTRYGSSSVFPLAPSLYSDQDTIKMSQQQKQQSFESTVPLSSNREDGVCPFDYNEQCSSQGQYYGADQQQQQRDQQQGTDITSTGGMVRAMSSSPDTRSYLGDQLQQQYGRDATALGSEHNMRRDTVGSCLMQTSEDIQPVLGKDGKTMVYICPMCTNTTKEFTTKSNLKRHLENKNIHDSPYERKRDQKRWQGHEKKKPDKTQNNMRMRSWRHRFPEKNRLNDMRSRVNKKATKIFGEADTPAKKEFVAAERERRTQMMLMRNSRRAEWVNQTSGTDCSRTTSCDSEFLSTSPASATAFQITNTDFTFATSNALSQGLQNENDSSMMDSQQMSAFSTTADSLPNVNDASMDDKSLSSDNRFYSGLTSRLRSRSAMNSPLGARAQLKHPSAVVTTAAGATSGLSATPQYPFFASNSFSSVPGNDSRLFSSSFGYQVPTLQVPTSSLSERRAKKQRAATDNPDMFRQSQGFVTTSEGSTGLGGYNGVAGGSSFQGGSYMDSNQQLQMLQQKYYPEAIPQTLMTDKNNDTQQSQSQSEKQQQQQSMDSVVEGMEIRQAMDLVTGTTSTSTAASGGIYGDRDASAWLSPSAAYHNSSMHPSLNIDDTRGYPFPSVPARDHKDMTRTLRIPQEQQQRQQQLHLNSQWIHSMNSRAASTGSDDLVSGSATSLDSPINSNHEQSPALSLAGVHSSSQSPMLSASFTNVGSVDGISISALNHNSGNNNNICSAMVTKSSKGSNLEVFSTSTTSLYGQSLSSSESGFFATESALGPTADYLEKEQPVGRRHSTHLSNLSM